MEFDMDVVGREVQSVKMKCQHTKVRLWFATVFLVACSVPFIRIILKANGTLSTAVATIYWLFVTRVGFTVIFYPWHLVVSKSLIYSDRLKTVASVVMVATLILVTAKSLLAPADLYRYETDSGDTTWWYSVVASLFWTVLLVGSFLVVPLYIRRMRLLKSKSWTLLSLVVPYVVVMLFTSVLHEWGGDFKWISYSIPLLIVFFGVASVVDICSNTNVKFDEAYIMVAGFLPYWLGTVLGRVLLTIFKDLGPLGSLFVFGSWKMLIFLFQVLSTSVGKKASRYNDGSVFAFCVIYTGSIYAEFIFQSVEFNSLQFWVLLAFRFLLIVVWQGGFKIDLATWVGEHVSSDWQLLRFVKRQTLSLLGNMPAETAERACMYTTSTAPPDVVLAFIRSRAVVVQATWVENDVKMAADFQAVASAAMAVTADFIWNYLGVGENMIKGSLEYKRGVLMIYVANIGTLFLAQALARRQLHSKVGKLKKDMSTAVEKIIALSKSTTTKDLLTKVVDERRSSLQDISQDTPTSGARDANGNGNDDDDACLNDLQDILSMTEALIPQHEAEGTSENQRRRSKGRRASGGAMSFFEVRRGSDSSLDADFVEPEDDEDDEWGGDINVAADDTTAILKGGYVKLQQPKSTKYQKRYVVLNDSHQLLFYNNKNLSGHMRDCKGVLKSTDVTNVQKGEEGTNRVDISSKLGMYSLEAYTLTEASEWYAALKGFVASSDVQSSAIVMDLERGLGAEKEDVFDFQSNPLAARPRRNSVRRCSLGGGEGESVLRPSLEVGTLAEKRGLLKKKNKFFWEERWFELTKNGMLTWYKKARGLGQGPVGAARGSLSLKDVISVEQQQGDSCLINVDIKGRTYELQADSEGLAAEWSAALVDWVAHIGELLAKGGSEEEVEVMYGEHDEVKPLVGISSAENKYNELIDRSSFSSSEYRGSEAFRDTFRSSDLRPTVSIHDQRLSFMPSTAHPSRKKGRRTSLRMSILQTKDVASDIHPSPPVIGQETHGWVKKKGASGKNAWQRRWVEIQQPGCLFWYSSDTEAAEGPKRAKGSLHVSNILSVDLLPEDSRCFDINVKNRTYAFQSYSEAEARYWYDVLLVWMQHAATQAELLQASAQPALGMKNPGVRGRPQRSGYLLKRGVGSSRWQSRWFVLSESGGLFWYKNPEESRVSVLKAKGSVQLADVLDVELNATTPTNFELYVKGRTYELNANSEENARAWISDIFKWITEFDADVSTDTENLIDNSDSTLLDVKESVNAAATRSSVMHSTNISGKDGGGEGQEQELDTLFLPEKVGMVKKKGEKKSAKWQLRWLELTRTNNGMLAYYKDQSEAESLGRAKGVIAMADVLSVEMSLSSASASSTGCFFDVDVQGRTFQFEADSATSAKEWHVALLSWVEHKRQKTEMSTIAASTSVSSRRPAKPYRRCSVVKVPKDLFPRVEEEEDNEDDPSERLLMPPSVSSNSRPVQPVARRGLLKKQGGSHGVWQERWCEVTAPGVLCWYGSEKDASVVSKGGRGGRGMVSKAKGRLFLKDVISVDSSRSSSKTEGEERDLTTAFDVDVKGRTYCFQAPSAEEARLWVESVGAWAAFAYSTQDLGLGGLEQDPFLSTASPRNRSSDSTSLVNQRLNAAVSTPTVNQLGLQVFEKSGMLKKQGGLFGKAWQSRWFVLRDDALTWYADQASAPSPTSTDRIGISQAKGSLGIHSILSVGTEGCAPCCFDIDIQGRTIKFQAPDENTMAEWLSVLRRNAKYLAEEVPENEVDLDTVTIDQMANFSPMFGVDSEGDEETDKKQTEGGEEESGEDDKEDEEVVMAVPEPIPEARDCLCEMLVVVERRAQEEEEQKRQQQQEEEEARKQALTRSIPPEDQQETAECETIDATNLKEIEETEAPVRSSAVLLAQKSMAFLPKAWMPNANNDASDSESSEDDDGSSLGSGEYVSDDGEEEEVVGEEEGLPRPHGTVVGIFPPISVPTTPPASGAVGSTERRHSKSCDLTQSSVRGRDKDQGGGRIRRGSDAADKVFVKTNAKTVAKNDNFLNKLKGNTAGELNREFWENHKKYLFHVTCFVTLHVLYVTSFVLKENDENAD